MKPIFALLPVLCLAACSTSPPAVPPQVFPLQVTRLTPSTDKASGAINLAIAARNTDGYTLRSALLTVVGYNAHGDVTGPAKTVQIDGPLKAENSSGQLLKEAVWWDADVRCVDIIAARVTSMDYATQAADGALAKAIVKEREGGCPK